jgi:DNA polymerase-1
MFYAFANNPLVNSTGTPTSVVFGYWNYILRLIRELKPTHLVIASDSKEPTFRHEFFSEYKANRTEMPEEMKVQLPFLDQMNQDSGIPILKVPGFEADDIMALLAKRYACDDTEVFLMTKDKDMMQIVSDHVKLMQLEKSGEPPVVVDREVVVQKFGVPPEQIRDLLALMGDASDNIPGVRKVGIKTAAGLLNQYGSLESVYQNIESITAKALKQNLLNDKENAYLSQRLVSLNTDIPLETNLKDYEFKGLDPLLDQRFQELELFSLQRHFKQMQKSFLTKADIAIDEKVQSDDNYILVNSEALLLEVFSELSACDLIALDTETTSLDAISAEIVGMCLSAGNKKGWYIPLGHALGGNVDIALLQDLWQNLLKAKDRKIIMHNAKYDLQIMANAGFMQPENTIDTMIASSLLNSGARENSLDFQVELRLGHKMIPITELIGSGKDQKNFKDLTPLEAFQYGAEDALYTYSLWSIYERELKDKDLLNVFYELEMPLVQCLRRMEANGICIDVAVLNGLSSELASSCASLEKTIQFHAGVDFNIASTKQLAQVLFEDLQLPHGKKTKTGYSTNAAVLEELRYAHPIVEQILEYRELTKLRNTYTDPLPKQISLKTGRLHTSFSQTITATGRLSSLNPNLQNIPIRTEYGKKVRRAFIAADTEHLLLAADYSQIELRVLAHLSQDSELCNAFSKDQDIHRQTAAAIFGVREGSVTPDQRRQAKVVNFGILYGMSAFRLSKDLGITVNRAKEFIEGYFSLYSGVRDYIDGTLKKARNLGYAQTLMGRRRYFPELESDNANIRNGAERMVVNTPIQGTAAEIMKRAMLLVEKNVIMKDPEVKMLLQVHDELVFEIPMGRTAEIAEIIRFEMENALSLIVPLRVDVGTGHNWLEAH